MTENLKQRPSVQLRLKNTHPGTLTMWLEPEGCHFEIPPGDEFLIEGEGPTAQQGLEIQVGSQGVVVWGSSGSVVSIFHNDLELTAPRERAEPQPLSAAS
jgi:hypothetical protein